MTSEEIIRSKLSSSDAPAIDSHQTESVREDDGANLQELITGCQHGNPAMQRELYDLSHHQLFRLAVRMVGRQDASDVCQQIYLKAFEAIKQFAGRSSLMTWLYRIAVN